MREKKQNGKVKIIYTNNNQILINFNIGLISVALSNYNLICQVLLQLNIKRNTGTYNISSSSVP